MNNRRFLWSALFATAVMMGGSALSAGGPFSQINRAKDPANLQGHEPAHVPQIDAPDSVAAGEPFTVTVSVGKTPHPSEPGHNIHWIELYADEVLLAHTNLIPVLTKPVVRYTLTLDESTTLRALSLPNHSAAWEGTKKITVVQKEEKKEEKK